MRPLLAAFIASTLLVACPVQAQDTKEEKIEAVLAEYAAIEMPAYDRNRASEPGYRDEYIKARQEALARKVEVSGKLLELDPSPEQLMRILPDRWSLMTYQLGQRDVLNETKKLIESPHSSVASEAAFWYATALNRFRAGTAEEQVAAAQAFMRMAPEDERAVRLVSSVADNETLSDETRISLYRSVIAKFPNARGVGYLSGKVRQIESIGKPFELAFSDAITGREISMSDLRGKVVVIDFWATWCGPCVAEMPKVKELYERYHDQGLEIIGVSLDQPEDKGGLEKLRAFCKEREIPWPQYYQGNYWNSEFSTSWGINSIPSVFLVDKQGNLVTTKARGRLEELVPEYLSRPGPEG